MCEGHITIPAEVEFELILRLKNPDDKRMADYLLHKEVLAFSSGKEELFLKTLKEICEIKIRDKRPISVEFMKIAQHMHISLINILRLSTANPATLGQGGYDGH